MASLSNSRLQNRKERQNRSTNNGDMSETAKCYDVCEWVCQWESERDKDKEGESIIAWYWIEY